MQLLGDLSYSIYLIHIPLALVFLVVNGGQYYSSIQFMWVVPLYLILLLGLSWASFMLFETPARMWLRRAFTRREPGPLFRSKEGQS